MFPWRNSRNRRSSSRRTMHRSHRALSVETLEGRQLLAFGATGVVTTNVAPNAGDWVEAVTTQSDGKVLAVGNVGLVRYLPDGELDTGFAAGGILNVPNSYLTSVAVQSDGKIVVGGQWRGSSKGGGDFLLIRLNVDGTYDRTFDGDGMATKDYKTGSRDWVIHLAIQGDGKIVAAGYYDNGWSSYSQWTVLRYNTNGSLDSTFDRDGIVTTSFSKGGNTTSIARSIAIQPDGRIIVVGQAIATDSRSDFAVVRYNSNGSLDNTFGNSGKVVTDFRADQPGSAPLSSDVARDVALLSDGRILVVGGATYSGQRFASARYLPSGALDTSFAGDGKQLLESVIGDSGAFKSVVIQADNKIVAAGGWYITQVARMNSDGSLDSNFDGDGWQEVRYSTETALPGDEGDILALQSDGKLIVGGRAQTETETNFGVARLNTDGSFDAALLLALEETSEEAAARLE